MKAGLRLWGRPGESVLAFLVHHRLEFESAPSAGGWQISSPGVLGSSPIEGALDRILEAGIEAILEKSVRSNSGGPTIVLRL